MATEHSMTSIMNAALSSQGLERIDPSQLLFEHRVLMDNWPLIVEAELEDGQYNFTRQEATLASRSDGSYGFDDSYLVPGDALFVRRLWVTRYSVRDDEIDWTQDGRRVHLNSTDGCTIEYVVSPDVQRFSANFARGVQMKLEACLLRAAKEEYQEAQSMENAAETYFQRARTASSKERRASKPYKEGRMARARFGRG